MTNTTPTDLQARMEKLVREVAKNNWYGEVYREAQAIVAELPKPIDPDVLAVREILAARECDSFDGIGYSTGSFDDHNGFRAALAAYRRIKADRA